MQFLRPVIVALSLFAGTASADTEEPKKNGWSFALFTGAMTNNNAGGSVNPQKVAFTDNYVAGAILGYSHALGGSNWSLGAELQFNRHFGKQDFGELVLPVVVRYHPEQPWLPYFDSLAFGLGGSRYTKLSQVEVDNYGDSRKTLIYWFLEAEIDFGHPRDSVFFRLHHRSNGFGAMMPNGGSNALVVGYRRDF
ncbi:hypothetical protein C1J03_01335 [Sulfitobacter sp. SK012]|nr:hypothetical protein C1J03_01335 [Sulfitobacter sp. SK012]